MNKSVFKIATLIILSLIWGTTWIVIKYTIADIPPFVGAMFRFVVALVFLYGYLLYKKISLKLPAGKFPYILLTAVLLYLTDFGAIYWGELYLNAGVTAIFFATYPLFTGILSTFLFKQEPFKWATFLGLLLGFLGVWIVFYNQLLQTQFDGIIIWASGGILLAAISAAFSTILSKKHFQDLHAASLTFHQMIWGVLMLGFVGLLRGEFANITWTLPAILSIVYLGIIASAVAFVLYYQLLKVMNPTGLSYIIYVTPIIAVFSGWLFLGESVNLQTILGTGLIFCGIAVSQIKR